MHSNEIQSQNALIAGVVSGDSLFAEAFFEKYEHLLYWCVEKVLINKSEDREDLLSLAKVGLFEAAHNFDSSKGTKFSTYAVESICYSLIGSFGALGGLSVDTGIKRLVSQYKKYVHESKHQNEVYSIDKFISENGVMNNQAIHLRWAVSVFMNSIDDISEIEESNHSSDEAIIDMFSLECAKHSTHKKIIGLVKESIEYLQNPIEREVGRAFINSILEDKDFSKLIKNPLDLQLSASSTYNIKVRVMKHIREFLEYHKIDNSVI